MLPFSAFFPVAVAFCLVHASRPWRLVTWSGCAALFLLHGWTTAAWVLHDAPHAESITRGYLSLIQALEAKGVTRLYTPEFPGSEILNFYARERIIASRVTAERYPPNFQALERDPTGLPVPPGTDRLADPEGTGASQETEQIGGYDMIRHVRSNATAAPPPFFRVRHPTAQAWTGGRPHWTAESGWLGQAVERPETRPRRDGRLWNRDRTTATRWSFAWNEPGRTTWRHAHAVGRGLLLLGPGCPQSGGTAGRRASCQLRPGSLDLPLP